MPDFEDLSEGLKTEVLIEMANTYFGARRELDMLFEEFDRLTDKLAKLGHEVMGRAGLVHVLLLGEEGAPGFYRAIGVDPEDVPFAVGKGPVAAMKRMPTALTRRGRWLKTLRRAYADYHDRARDYMRGHTQRDSKDPRRKRLSLHYGQLAALAERINAKIRHVNEDLPMREALEYAKRLDPQVVEQEKMAGGGEYHEESSRGDKDFVPIDFEHLGIRPVPDLPQPKAALKSARTWLKDFYREHETEILAVMDRLKAGEQPFSR